MKLCIHFVLDWGQLAGRARGITRLLLSSDNARDENTHYLSCYGKVNVEICQMRYVPVGVQRPNNHGGARQGSGFVFTFGSKCALFGRYLLRAFPRSLRYALPLN